VHPRLKPYKQSASPTPRWKLEKLRAVTRLIRSGSNGSKVLFDKLTNHVAIPSLRSRVRFLCVQMLVPETTFVAPLRSFLSASSAEHICHRVIRFMARVLEELVAGSCVIRNAIFQGPVKIFGSSTVSS
jgi:hypothetical protein